MFFLIIGLSLLLTSCKKEEPIGNEERQRPSYEALQENLRWDCAAFESNYSIIGTIRDEGICFGEDVEDYKIYASGGWNATTETGELMIGEGQSGSYRYYNIGFRKLTDDDHLIPKIRLITAYYPYVTEYRTIFNESFSVGTKTLSENDIKTKPKSGFSVEISGSYRNQVADEYTGAFTLSTSYGSQEGSTFEITEITRRIEGDYEFFDITAIIDCNMYHHMFNLGKEPELYGRLQAEMKLAAKFLLEE